MRLDGFAHQLDVVIAVVADSPQCGDDFAERQDARAQPLTALLGFGRFRLSPKWTMAMRSRSWRISSRMRGSCPR